MAVAFNASLIKSSVDLGDNAKSQAHQRPLMGQSPYIVNGGLFYEDFDKKFQWNILYNVVGERLYAAGSDGNPDIYEMPRHQLDISVSKGFGKHLELKAGVRDLLNNAYVLKQDGNQDGNLDHKDEIISTYKPGYSYTLGISYKL